MVTTSERLSAISPIVFGLIALGALAHSSWNLLLKRVGHTTYDLLWWTFIVGAVALAPLGITSLVGAGFQWHWVAIAAVCGIFEVIYFSLLQNAYRSGDVSLIYPMARGTGPTLSVIGAIVILGERPSPLAIAGVAVVVAGIAVISTAGARGAGKARLKSVLYGLSVGFYIACFTLWDGWAVGTLDLPPVGYYWMALIGQVVFMTPLALRTKDITASLKAHPWVTVAIGVLAPMSYMLALTAIQLSSVSLVAPAREVSVVLVALGGAFFFGEKHVVQRVIGSVVVLSGVALLALG